MSMSVVQSRRFRSFFGVTPHVCTVISQKILIERSILVVPEHLLWSLLYLKIYVNEHVLASMAGVDEKTYRGHVRETIFQISSLQCVSSHHLLPNQYYLT